MSSPYLLYVTHQRERWDWIAWKFYGDPSLLGAIVQANPDVPIVGALDAGIELQIPILEIPSIGNPSNDLPPWETL